MAKGKSSTSLKNRMEDLVERIEDVEGRLERLEKSARSSPKRKGSKGNKKSSSSSKGENPTKHNYLRKTINDAKRRYEREHRM